MILFQSPSTDPFFNLALEEYLFGQSQLDFILIYINRDAVICGKHQNAVAESNTEFLIKNNVPLIRRFSGGGTVYHDEGNVNISFIHTGEDSKVIDFKRYALQIIDFLKSVNVSAELTERNDIFVDGKKITGNAAHAKNKRALHHGTLLFDSKLDKLSAGLKSNPDKFKSRAVKSNRSPVTNLKNYLKAGIEINEFVSLLSEFLSEEFEVKGNYQLEEEAIPIINTLVESKFKTFEWNYGYGPKYDFDVSFSYDNAKIVISVEVEEGIIKSIDSSADSSSIKWSKFIGLKHDWIVISNKLAEIFGQKSAQYLVSFFF